MTRRQIMTVLHRSPDTAERLAAALNVEVTMLTSELKTLEALDLVRKASNKTSGGDGTRWVATHSTVDASVAAMEQHGEDPDLEITAYHPLQPRH